VAGDLNLVRQCANEGNRYIPDGNHKFGAITIDTTNEEQAVLKYRLFVDGEETWSWVLAAPAAGKKASMKKKLKQWA
jgi:alkaline phosphatase D